MAVACTFRPLSRGRYRYVDPDPKAPAIIVKAAALEAFRRRKFSETHPRPGRPKVPTLASVRVNFRDSFLNCPHCRRENYVGAGVKGRHECDKCSKPFTINRQTEDEYWARY